MSAEPWTDASILVVDDDFANVLALERILQRAEYANVHTTNDAREALALYERVRPDLVVLDWHMPFLNGHELLTQLAPLLRRDGFVPVLVITADATPEVKQRALGNGAKDFLNKPFNYAEALLRIRNLLEARSLYLAVQEQTRMLEERVRERSAELARAQVDILNRLALAAEFRDDDTRLHTQRVGEMSERIARELGLADALAQLLRLAAPLHDLGKIAVPDHILLKLGRLSDEEFTIIKSHTTVGASILAGSRYPLLQMAERIALMHHEHWDGTGYTPGVQGEQIPLVSRIVAVADVFDALTHARPYKPAWSEEDALAEIVTQRGRAFDPAVVDALVTIVRRRDVHPADVQTV
ncbi:MAG: response regulator [Vicinamibacterales bacterium]